MQTDVDTLLAQASEAAGGLTDPGDPSHREALEVFLTSAAEDGALTAIGEASVEATVVASLVNRLRVTDWHARHPEVGAAPVESPIFLIGLPRTGTTALSHLLSTDPANRSLLMWEATESVPPPTTEGYRDDPRFVAAMEAPNMMEFLNPGFKAIHFDPPDMPVECATVLGQHFTSLHLATVYNIDGYMQWLLQADHTSAYAYHRQVLQVLQSRCPGQWQLKSPVHLVDPFALGATYPDARYVLTHRDPLRVTASVLSLVRSLTSTFSDADRTEYIARTWTDVVVTLLERQTAFRDAMEGQGRGASFVDVAYADLVADPIGTVATIYDQLGTSLSTEAEAAMRHHAATHTQGAHGSHAYALEDFGVDAVALAERFADYNARYGEFLEARP
jgi:hypothetical protein